MSSSRPRRSGAGAPDYTGVRANAQLDDAIAEAAREAAQPLTSDEEMTGDSDDDGDGQIVAPPAAVPGPAPHTPVSRALAAGLLSLVDSDDEMAELPPPRQSTSAKVAASPLDLTKSSSPAPNISADLSWEFVSQGADDSHAQYGDDNDNKHAARSPKKVRLELNVAGALHLDLTRVERLSSQKLLAAFLQPDLRLDDAALVQGEMMKRIKHGRILIEGVDFNDLSLPSSRSSSVAGDIGSLDDNAVFGAPSSTTAHTLQPQLAPAQGGTTSLVKVDGKHLIGLQKGGKASKKSVKITNSMLNPQASLQAMIGIGPCPPEPDKAITSLRSASICKHIEMDRLGSSFATLTSTDVQQIKAAICVLYDVYIRMRSAMPASLYRLDQASLAASAMFANNRGFDVNTRRKQLDHAASNAALVLARKFTTVRGPGAGQGLQSQTGLKVGAYLDWDALLVALLAALPSGDPDWPVIQEMVKKVSTWWGKGQEQGLQRYASMALTLSIRDAPKVVAVDHPHLAVRPADNVVNACSYDDIVSHPSYSSVFQTLKTRAIDAARQMHRVGRKVSEISRIRINYELSPALEVDVKRALRESAVACHGRPPVTGGLRLVADDEALGWDGNEVAKIWTPTAHEYIRRTIKEELEDLKDRGAGNEGKAPMFDFNGDRQKLAYFSRAVDRSTRSSGEALGDAHHLRHVTSAVSQASAEAHAPFNPPIQSDPLFGTVQFERDPSKSALVKLAGGILSAQRNLLLKPIDVFIEGANCEMTDYSVVQHDKPMRRAAPGSQFDYTVTIAERLAGGQMTVQAGAVSVFFTGSAAHAEGNAMDPKNSPVEHAAPELFTLAVYPLGEEADEPEPGTSQEVGAEARDFFAAKGWSPGAQLLSFKDYIQDFLGDLGDFKDDYQTLVSILSSAAHQLQPLGSGFPNGFGCGATLDALHLIARLLASLEADVGAAACGDIWRWAIHLIALSALATRPAALTGCFEAGYYSLDLGPNASTIQVVDKLAEMTTLFNYAQMSLILHTDSLRHDPSQESLIRDLAVAYGAIFAAYSADFLCGACNGGLIVSEHALPHLDKTSGDQRQLSWCTTQGRRTASRRTWTKDDLAPLFEEGEVDVAAEPPRAGKADKGKGKERAHEEEIAEDTEDVVEPPKKKRRGPAKDKKRDGGRTVTATRTTSPCYYEAQKLIQSDSARAVLSAVVSLSHWECKVGRGRHSVAHLVGVENKNDEQNDDKMQDEISVNLLDKKIGAINLDDPEPLRKA